ncbi:MAG: hypothetical protein VW405_05005 [Rhodospirillaceae bacterium]
MRRSNRARDAALTAVCQQLNHGTLELFGGTRPARPSDPPGGAPLARLAFQSPAFVLAEDGIAQATPLEAVLAVGSGTLSWFRAVSASGAVVFDGTIGLGGDVDMVVTSTTVTQHASVSVAAMTYYEPSGDE